ncbi:hypothetical protein FQN57_005218 [Myotisia sp. PD_48]|nr:hypothetical protein FQN57_005218 [Myotisia sp. PD_48]
MDKEVYCHELYVDGSSNAGDDGHEDLGNILRNCRKKSNTSNEISRPASRISEPASPQFSTSHIVQGQSEEIHQKTGKNKQRKPNKQPSSHINQNKQKIAPDSKKPKWHETEPKMVSKQQRIFKNLVFYFIPNNEISPARRIRMEKTIEFGATRAAEFDSSVTHVIVDKNLDYGDVIKYMGVEAAPADVILVNDTYPSECIINRNILDPKKLRFRVKRVNALTVEPRSQTSKAQVPNIDQISGQDSIVHNLVSQKQDEASDLSLEHGPIYDGPESGEFARDDPLEDIIRDVKNSPILPFDSDDEVEDMGSSTHLKRDVETIVEGMNAGNHSEIQPSVPVWQQSFSCMHKHTADERKASPNSHTVDILRKMLNYYERVSDHWRCLAYRRAITALQRQEEKIITRDQAIKVPGIGERIAAKIEEIAWTNRLRQLEQTNMEPRDILISQFLNVYGVGFRQASKWVAQGYTSLEELKSQVSLTENQRIGIEHYDDFLQRIPRMEVEAHGIVVREAVLKVDSAYQVIVAGSYRREAVDSGDIDVIICKDASLEEINAQVMDMVVPELFNQGYLKASLAVSSRTDGSKWHGASVLPGKHTWRRIDLLFVPRAELGAALIYFTGNDIFNRSLRLLASKKGMCLNQRGLFGDVMRMPGRIKINSGHLLESQDEKRIFELLGVPWRPPHHRIC